MARERKGTTIERDGKIYARVTYVGADGKRHAIWRRAENKTHARELKKQLIRELEDHGESTVQKALMTFNELADHVETKYLIPPQYVDERKVAGLRSYYNGRLHLRTLRDYFGNRKLRSITRGDLERFKADRLKTPTRHEKQRSIASVNRELALLTRMLKIAHSEGWIIKNPAEIGKTLISLADERKRERIVTSQEEASLLAACVKDKAHLRPILICAFDTGMRLGEILKLKWKDIDFTTNVINVCAFNTKTMKARQLAISNRLEQALWEIYQSCPDNPDALVFGIKNNVKHSFNSVRTTAKLPDVRFHDIRHTHATRLVSAHMPLAEVGRILGHTQPITTYRYVNANIETAQRAAAIINAFNENKQLVEDNDVIN